mgnify:CR=1 FL=1
MKIGIISGSARKGNNTLRVAKAIQRIAGEAMILDLQEYDLPNFTGDPLPLGKESVFQKKFISLMEEANLVFFLTPEYNWFPSAEIINIIHTFGSNSYKHLFDNKVIATVGVSVGRGGRMPAVQLGYVLNKLISFLNLDSVVSPKHFEAQEVTSCISLEGELQENQAFNKGIESFVSYSLKLAKRWQETA